MNNAPVQHAEEIIKGIAKKWCIDNIELIAPAVITDVSDYGVDRTVTVLPLVIERDDDGVAIVPTECFKCPVFLQASPEGYVSFPLKAGQMVAVGYTKHCVEQFTAGVKDQLIPTDYRVFGASDAVVLGYWATPSDLKVSPDNFEIKFKDTLISITPDNKVTINTPNSVHLITGEAEINIQGGEVASTNASGNCTLLSSGAVDANGCTITTGGNVITANGTDLDQLKADHDALQASYIAHGVGTTTAPNHPPSV